jgi:hypothetical protein
MTIRSLDLLDLPILYRHRSEVLSLDAIRMLTRGNPLGAVGLMAYMNPARQIYGAIAAASEESDGDGDRRKDSVLGGIIQNRGERYAKLLYLAPSSNLHHPEFANLMDNLAEEAGTWGAFHIRAEADENGDAFTLLRRSGFAVYAWQRMWDVSDVTGPSDKSGWKRVRSIHLPAVQSLYHQIIPPLMLPVEPAPDNPLGWICNDEVKCYAGVNQGVYGIVLTPLIHPEIAEVGEKLASLISCLPDRRGRSIYVCVRSYQAWLEPVLEDLGAKAGYRQAVMIKHLSYLIKDEQMAKVSKQAGVSVQPSSMNRIGQSKP